MIHRQASDLQSIQGAEDSFPTSTALGAGRFAFGLRSLMIMLTLLAVAASLLRIESRLVIGNVLIASLLLGIAAPLTLLVLGQMLERLRRFVAKRSPQNKADGPIWQMGLSAGAAALTTVMGIIVQNEVLRTAQGYAWLLPGSVGLLLAAWSLNRQLAREPLSLLNRWHRSPSSKSRGVA